MRGERLRLHPTSNGETMRRKARVYTDWYEPKKIEPEHITENELALLSLEEMMERANGKEEKCLNQPT